MAAQHTATYLNDHLTGSVTALELLAQLAEAYRGTPAGDLAVTLRSEVEADQEELKALIERTGAGAGMVRAAAGWLAEKVARLKLAADDTSGGPLRLLESLEVLSLGVEGKRGLWLALQAASQENPDLSGPNYAELARRAERQRAELEAARLAAAREALRSPAGS